MMIMSPSEKERRDRGSIKGRLKDRWGPRESTQRSSPLSHDWGKQDDQKNFFALFFLFFLFHLFLFFRFPFFPIFPFHFLFYFFIIFLNVFLLFFRKFDV